MKTTAIIIAAAMCATACTEIREEAGQTEAFGGERVEIAFSTADPTRAFFDGSSTAETWEAGIVSARVMVYDEDGNFAISRTFTQAELAARRATFSIPKRLAGSTCTFVAVANGSTADAETLEGLEAELEDEAASYNGTFQTVATSSARSGGFTMSGRATSAVAGSGTTKVGIQLSRIVAKVAVRTTVTDEFALRYPGTLAIDEVKVEAAAAKALVLDSGAEATAAATYSHTQVPEPDEDTLQSLFYLYPCGARGADARVTLVICGTYDSDGDAATTADRFDVRYRVGLGAQDGSLARNGYYRLSIGISGLEEQKCEVDITVMDWADPVTGEVNLGC